MGEICTIKKEDTNRISVLDMLVVGNYFELLDKVSH